MESQAGAVSRVLLHQHGHNRGSTEDVYLDLDLEVLDLEVFDLEALDLEDVLDVLVFLGAERFLGVVWRFKERERERAR